MLCLFCQLTSWINFLGEAGRFGDVREDGLVPGSSLSLFAIAPVPF